MEEIKKLEKKIEVDKNKLNKYRNQKFNKRSGTSQRNLKRELKEDLWKEQKKIIEAYIKTQKIKQKKINYAHLGRMINVSEKTAKKYLHLISEWIEPKRKQSNKPKWNENRELKAVVIELLCQAIKRTTDHLGHKELLTLSDLIDDILIDLPKNTTLKYSTVHNWIKYNNNIEMKYETKKRKHILKMIAIIEKQIQLNNNKLKNLKKIKVNDLNEKIVSIAAKKLNENIPDKHTSKVIFKGGSVVQWDGGEDTISRENKGCRLQVVDASGYSYSMNYTKQETNLSYRKALANLLRVTHPAMILGDKRKGVNPIDNGALIANICKELHITLSLSSDSNHKALVEKDHGLVRSKNSLYFSRHNIKTVEEADKHSERMNYLYNKKHGYKKPKYYGKPVSEDIIKFIVSEKIQIIRPHASNFFFFEKEGYYPLNIDGNRKLLMPREPIVISKINNEVLILQDNHLYRTEKIPYAEITSKTYANKILKDKFKKNGSALVNEESMQYWLKDHMEGISHKIKQEVKESYQNRITELIWENKRLRKELKIEL